jgi:acylaminoacyl-peptidase
LKLTTHLIGQYPDFYKVAATRNPVTDLVSMYTITDIPDWVLCEGLGENNFDYKRVITPDIHQQLYKASPIAFIDNVKTPTLLMIGNIDLRVPPTQGLEFHKALISRNIPSK